MHIAFHAPLKPPHHPTPSGDREMARLLVRAMERGGFVVELATPFRSLDASGNPQRQRRLSHMGERLADRIIERIDAALCVNAPIFGSPITSTTRRQT